MSPRLKSALVLAMVFVLGVVTGGMAMRAHEARRRRAIAEAPGPIRRQEILLIALGREVRLTGAQRDAIRAIVAKHEPEAAEVRQQVRPQVVDLYNRVMEEVRQVLRPDQMPGFERFAKESRRRVTE